LAELGRRIAELKASESQPKGEKEEQS